MLKASCYTAQVHAPPRQESLLLRPGVLGDRLPRLSASVIPVSAGDVLIFATDGLREGFAAHSNLRDSPQQIADRILDQYGRETDDALVLVARYLHGKADDHSPLTSIVNIRSLCGAISGAAVRRTWRALTSWDARDLVKAGES